MRRDANESNFMHDLIAQLETMGSPRVALVGDFMLDREAESGETIRIGFARRRHRLDFTLTSGIIISLPEKQTGTVVARTLRGMDPDADH